MAHGSPLALQRFPSLRPQCPHPPSFIILALVFLRQNARVGNELNRVAIPYRLKLQLRGHSSCVQITAVPLWVHTSSRMLLMQACKAYSLSLLIKPGTLTGYLDNNHLWLGLQLPGICTVGHTKVSSCVMPSSWGPKEGCQLRMGGEGRGHEGRVGGLRGGRGPGVWRDEA
jgi:hypothetical protein